MHDAHFLHLRVVQQFTNQPAFTISEVLTSEQVASYKNEICNMHAGGRQCGCLFASSTMANPIKKIKID